MGQTVGDIINNLYEIWQVNHRYWSSEEDKSHLEFELNNFNPTCSEQINLVAELCILVKSGEWQTNFEVLKKLYPFQEFDSNIAEEIINYFSGVDYQSSDSEFDEYIQNQRNPFILELLSHIMLLSIENLEACTPLEMSLQGVHYMHLSSKKQGLDLAAIAKEKNTGEFFLIIGESKNRKIPSDGTKEAFGAFKVFDSGGKWPDIRQVMKAVANSFEDQNDRLSKDISTHILWKKNMIFRLTIEHRSKRPKKGSQFRDFKTFTPNVRCGTFRQCEAIFTDRLDEFYNRVSQRVIQLTKEREVISSV